MSLKRVHHTAVVVHDLDEAVDRWIEITGGTLSDRRRVADQGVEIAMLALGDTTIELVQPLDSESGTGRFLQRRGESLHHIGIEVDGIANAMEGLVRRGVGFVDPEPRRGVHGAIAFARPTTTGGVLIELIEPASGSDGRERAQGGERGTGGQRKARGTEDKAGRPTRDAQAPSTIGEPVMAPPEPAGDHP